MIANLPREKSEEVLSEMEHREAHARVTELMRFDENTAGGMMNTELSCGRRRPPRAGKWWTTSRFHEIMLDQLDNTVLINREGGAGRYGAGGAAGASQR